jgi:hypothetical protein
VEVNKIMRRTLFNPSAEDEINRKVKPNAPKRKARITKIGWLVNK